MHEVIVNSCNHVLADLLAVNIDRGGAAQVTDKELFDLITAGAVSTPDGSGHASFLADRAEVSLRTAARMGCRTRVEALVHLGKHFRVVLPNVTDTDSDLEVCDHNALTMPAACLPVCLELLPILLQRSLCAELSWQIGR